MNTSWKFFTYLLHVICCTISQSLHTKGVGSETQFMDNVMTSIYEDFPEFGGLPHLRIPEIQEKVTTPQQAIEAIHEGMESIAKQMRVPNLEPRQFTMHGNGTIAGLKTQARQFFGDVNMNGLEEVFDFTIERLGLTNNAVDPGFAMDRYNMVAERAGAKGFAHQLAPIFHAKEPPHPTTMFNLMGSMLAKFNMPPETLEFFEKMAFMYSGNKSPSREEEHQLIKLTMERSKNRTKHHQHHYLPDDPRAQNPPGPAYPQMAFSPPMPSKWRGPAYPQMPFAPLNPSTGRGSQNPQMAFSPRKPEAESSKPFYPEINPLNGKPRFSPNIIGPTATGYFSGDPDQKGSMEDNRIDIGDYFKSTSNYLLLAFKLPCNPNTSSVCFLLVNQYDINKKGPGYHRGQWYDPSAGSLNVAMGIVAMTKHATTNTPFYFFRNPASGMEFDVSLTQKTFELAENAKTEIYASTKFRESSDCIGWGDGTSISKARLEFCPLAATLLTGGEPQIYFSLILAPSRNVMKDVWGSWYEILKYGGIAGVKWKELIPPKNVFVGFYRGYSK